MPLRVALGAALVGLGVLGLFLPFLQGILFITVGLMILAHDVPRVRRWTNRLKGSRTVRGMRARLRGIRRALRRQGNPRETNAPPGPGAPGGASLAGGGT